MSDESIWSSPPTGRRLETGDVDPRYVGTIGVLGRADEASLRVARRNMREIPAKDIEGEGKYLLEKTSGETLEVITSHVELIDPETSGATAFTVRDGLLVPLRPVGWRHEANESRRLGEVFGRKATGRDPMPISDGPVIR